MSIDEKMNAMRVRLALRKAKARAHWEQHARGDQAKGIVLADCGDIAAPSLPDLPGKAPAR